MRTVVMKATGHKFIITACIQFAVGQVPLGMCPKCCAQFMLAELPRCHCQATPSTI